MSHFYASIQGAGPDAKVIYSIERGDIKGIVEGNEDYAGKLTEAVINEVERQLFKLDFSDMADTIRGLIDDVLADPEMQDDTEPGGE